MLKKTSQSDQIEAEARLYQTYIDAWALSPVPSSAKWISDTIRMSPEVEASGDRYNLDERPYWRAVLDAFDDPYIDEIVIQKSTQVGGTVTLWAHMLWKACWRPAPCMVVLPDRESAIEFRDRVYLNASANPITADMVPPKKEWNSRWIDLGTMRIYLAWSGSAQKLRMRACQTVYLSEVDVFGTTPGSRGGDPNRAAAERTKSFYLRQIYRESSPTAEPSTIGKEYQQTNKGKWLCPCPYCGRHQELRFFVYKEGEYAKRGGFIGLEDEYGQLVDADAAEQNAKYCCVNGCTIEPHEINGMVRAGVYADAGQDVDVTGQVTKPFKKVRKWGLQLWSIHSPTISLGQIAREYVQQKRSGNLADFFTNWLGVEYSSARKLPTWEQLGKKYQSVYERGEVWHESYFVTTGVDVQGDRTKYVTWAYGDRCSMWLVDWGELWRDINAEKDDIADDLRQLWDRVISRSYTTFQQRENPFKQRTVYNRLVTIDSNHRTLDVHNFVRWCNNNELVRAIRGDHNVLPQEKYRPRIVDRNSRTGEIYPGGLKQWGLFVTLFKKDLIRRMTANPQHPGCIHFPREMQTIGKLVLQELINEPPKRKPNRQGRIVEVFEQRSESIPIDFWDGTVYSRAAAEMVVDLLPLKPGWDAARWPIHIASAS